MSVLLYTGKGGVGKTCIASATAAYLAQTGKRVLIMSTDLAHSLGDCFDHRLSADVTHICPYLDAIELDPNKEGERAWGRLHDYLKQIIRVRSGNALEASEALLFPGLEELFSLLRILDAFENERYDVIIADCAPTGETLSLLRYPGRLSTLADQLLPWIRKMTSIFGPLISQKTTVPQPEDAVFAEFDQLVRRLSRLQQLLLDKESASIRLVMTPERIVIDEAIRAHRLIREMDFQVDAVYINKIYPSEALAGYFSAFEDLQEENIRRACDYFDQQHIFRLWLQPEELRGPEALNMAAKQLYLDKDP